jgi:CheY-like chemotaxis protein
MSERFILLVEDNANDELLTLRALKKNNILNRVLVLRDGAEALDWLLTPRPPAEQPHIVLLDLNLPKIGGLEVLRRLRANPATRLLPVVILTSSKQDRDLGEGYDAGANSYVVKPVDFVQFSESVRQIGLYWLNCNERPPGGA